MDFLPTLHIGESGIEHLPSHDGKKLAVRVSGASGTRTPVVMLHGLQSHSGWFMQSQMFLANLGCPVYAMDRRGSGLSEGAPGDCADYREIMEDVGVVVEHARARHGVEGVHVFGHCFGAIPAALFASGHPEVVYSLIQASSGLYTHVSITFKRKLRVLWSKAMRDSSVAIPIPLTASMFSEQEECVKFIHDDDRRLRTATARFYFEVMRARRYIRAHRHLLVMPQFMANAGDDPICNNLANERFFWSLPARHRLLVRYQQSRHVIEFSAERDNFFRDLAWWVERFGGEHHAPALAT